MAALSIGPAALSAAEDKNAGVDGAYQKEAGKSSGFGLVGVVGLVGPVMTIGGAAGRTAPDGGSVVLVGPWAVRSKRNPEPAGGTDRGKTRVVPDGILPGA